MELSDDVLVRACLAGDRSAFAALMERHVRRVFAIAYSERLSEGDAADVAQGSFTRAYDRLNQLRRPDRFGAWIARIAYHQARDYRRLRRTEIPTDMVRLLEDRPVANDAIGQFESIEDARTLISKGLAALPKNLREPLTMHYMGRMSHSDIAELLSTSVSGIDMRVSRARQRLGEWFRRNGLDDECADVLRTYGASWPLSALVIDPALSKVQQAPVPSQAGFGRYFGSLIGSCVCVAGILVGIAGAHVRTVAWADLRMEGTLRPADVMSVGVAHAGPYSAPGRPGRVRRLIRPGDELRGWIPQERDKDTSLPRSTGGVAVFANDFGAYKRVPPAYGEVTLEVRVKVRIAPYQSDIGFTLAGEEDGAVMLSKTPDNLWTYRTDERRRRGEDYAPFCAATDGWRRFRLVYRTWEGRYDLIMDDRVVRRDILTAWTAGQPITGVYLHSGRGDVGEPMHFSDMRLSVRDATAHELATAAPPPAAVEAVKARDRMALVSGRINGATLSVTDPAVTVAAGSPIRGRLEVTVTNEHESSADFPVIETPTWGDAASSYTVVAEHVPLGIHTVTVSVDRRAPDAPGTYYIIIAGAAETSPAYVASGTNWPVGEPRWNNGTDISGWSPTLIRSAMATGTAWAPWLGHSGRTKPAEVGAVAVRVNVESDSRLTMEDKVQTVRRYSEP